MTKGKERRDDKFTSKWNSRVTNWRESGRSWTMTGIHSWSHRGAHGIKKSFFIASTHSSRSSIPRTEIRTLRSRENYVYCFWSIQTCFTPPIHTYIYIYYLSIVACASSRSKTSKTLFLFETNSWSKTKKTMREREREKYMRTSPCASGRNAAEISCLKWASLRTQRNKK